MKKKLILAVIIILPFLKSSSGNAQTFQYNIDSVGMNRYALQVFSKTSKGSGDFFKVFKQKALEVCRGGYTILEIDPGSTRSFFGVIECKTLSNMQQKPKSHEPQQYTPPSTKRSLPIQVRNTSQSQPINGQDMSNQSTSSGVAAFRQSTLRFGVRGCYSNFSGFGLGGNLLLNLERLYTGLNGDVSFGYFFPDVHDYFEFNGNLIWHLFNMQPDFIPYFGGGLHVGFYDPDSKLSPGTETEIGINILGGIKYVRTGKRAIPFFEFKYGPGGSGLAIFSLGILF